MKYKVKNWREFQHYKDRNPPWIKLHFALLSSSDWVVLADASRVLAVACMLVASKNEGVIDGSARGLEYLKRVAYLNSEPDLNPLIECGFLECASDLQADASKTLAVARTETEKKAITRAPRKTSIPKDFSISERVKKWAEVNGHHSLQAHFENFVGAAKAKGYTYADWDAALMRAVKDNWAKVPPKVQERPNW